MHIWNCSSHQLIIVQKCLNSANNCLIWVKTLVARNARDHRGEVETETRGAEAGKTAEAEAGGDFFVKFKRVEETYCLPRLVLTKVWNWLQCVTIPKIWTKPNPNLFSDTKYFRYRFRYFFRYQIFSDTESDNLIIWCFCIVARFSSFASASFGIVFLNIEVVSVFVIANMLHVMCDLWVKVSGCTGRRITFGSKVTSTALPLRLIALALDLIL